MAINYIPDKKDYKYKLHPFKRFVLQNFPFIEADFDALTNYELMAKIIEYLNQVIDNENVVEENVDSLYNAVVSLQNYINNYFDNLNVQEEINNKLDEMAEDGELADIIAQYLTIAGVLAYDTVALMKVATNLTNGSICRTLGYANKNDGLGDYYKVREILNTDVIDDINIISLQPVNLVAEKIHENKIMYFNNVSDMINCDNLSVGDVVKTLGYYSVNDRGGATYIITNVEDTNAIQIEVGDLYATMIIDSISPEQLGAVIDGVSDDALIINVCLDYSKRYGVPINFYHSKYYIKTSIELPINVYSIDFQGITLVCLNNISNGAVSCKYYTDTEDINKPEGYVKNLTLDLNNVCLLGFHIQHSWRKVFDTLNVIHAPENSIAYKIAPIVEDGITFNSGGNTFNNIRGKTYLTTTVNTIYFQVLTNDNSIVNSDYQFFSKGYDIHGFTRCEDLHGYVDGSMSDANWDKQYFMVLTDNGWIEGGNLYPDTQKHVIYSNTVRTNNINNLVYVYPNNALTRTDPIIIFEGSNNYSFYRSLANQVTISIPSQVTYKLLIDDAAAVGDAIRMRINKINAGGEAINPPFLVPKATYSSADPTVYDFLGAYSNHLICVGTRNNNMSPGNDLALANLNTASVPYNLIPGYYGCTILTADNQLIPGFVECRDTGLLILKAQSSVIATGFKFFIDVPLIELQKSA